jgi:APA family basic amino acid/polyamine antiporter
LNLFARKSIDQLRADAFTEDEHSLRRALGPVNLVALGIGAIIGTGIFVLTGSAAAQYAGPAIVLSFVLAGVGCVFAGLCYSEFASMIPIAGSAYTYGYATLGELVAWIIGWDLILEYLFGAATVAVGWSGYVVSFLRDLGLVIPPQWSNAPGIELVQPPGSSSFAQVTPQLLESLAAQGVDVAALPQATGVFNVVAVVAIAALTTLLVIGIKESARFNSVIVVTKLTVILMFILAGAWFLFGNPAVASENWSPFIPPNEGGFGQFGWSGILRAAGVIFFAYIGFDAVSTTAQEAKNPQRDMPIGILGSLLICTVLYILVSGILTAMVPYSRLNVPEPIAVGIDVIGLDVLSFLVKIGAIAGLSSVMLVMLMGQPRIFYSMSRDGLLPRVFSKVHSRFRTPYVTTILTGVVCAVVAGLVPIRILGELVSIGTLLAFVIVCAGVWYLRRKEPDRERPFRTPWVPLVPILGIGVCLGMMLGLPRDTWLRLIIWMAFGIVIYFAYSRRHSLIQQAHVQAREREPAMPTYTEPKSRVGSESQGRPHGRGRGRRGGRGRGRGR